MTDTPDTNDVLDTVEIRPWVRRGAMLVNAECLDHDDPDHVYNQILAQGKMPEQFGFKHPLSERFNGMKRADLILEILRLEKELTAYARAFG